MKAIVLSLFLLSLTVVGQADDEPRDGALADQGIVPTIESAVRLSWPSQSGEAYLIEVSSDLQNWQEVATVQGQVAATSWHDAVGQTPQRYYRITPTDATPPVWRVPASFTGMWGSTSRLPNIVGGEVWVEEVVLSDCCPGPAICPSLRWSGQFWGLSGQTSQGDWTELTGTIIPQTGVMRTDMSWEFRYRSDYLSFLRSYKLEAEVTLTEGGFTAVGTISRRDSPSSDWRYMGEVEITGRF